MNSKQLPQPLMPYLSRFAHQWRARFGILIAAGTLTVPAYPEQEGSLVYTINDNAITISGSAADVVEVSIPEKIAGLPVSTIGARAFQSRENLTKVTLPESIASIQAYAFYGCKKLSSAKLPSSLKRIGSGAFNDCVMLADVTIPKGLASFDDPAFGGCASLSAFKVEAGNPAYSAKDGVLFSKDGAMLLQYPAGKAGPYVIPDSVAQIALGAFYRCRKLTGIIRIPSKVTTIEERTFQDTGLTGVVIPEGVTEIRSMAFLASLLTRVTIPSSVTKIDESAFGEGLQAFTVDNANPSFSSLDGVLFDKNKIKLIRYPKQKVGESYTIPGGVSNIGFAAFRGCSKLTSITIPGSLTLIGLDAFYGCEKLTTVAFNGNAPSLERVDGSDPPLFFKSASDFTIHFRRRATGFTTPTWQGFPAKEIDADAMPLVPSGPLSWTSNGGKTIKGSFAKLDGEAVVVQLEDGKEHKIPFTRLSPESITQAKKLGGSR